MNELVQLVNEENSISINKIVFYARAIRNTCCDGLLTLLRIV